MKSSVISRPARNLSLMSVAILALEMELAPCKVKKMQRNESKDIQDTETKNDNDCGLGLFGHLDTPKHGNRNECLYMYS